MEALQERIRQETLDAGDCRGAIARRDGRRAIRLRGHDAARAAGPPRPRPASWSFHRGQRREGRRGGIRTRRATAQYEEAAGELDAKPKKKVSDLESRSTAIWEVAAALSVTFRPSKDAEKMTAERETARRRHAENTEALSTASPTCRWWRGAPPSWR